MTRVFRAFLLTAGVLAAWAGAAYAQGMGSIFGKVTDSSGGVLPGVTVTVTGAALQQPLVGDDQRKRHLPVPQRADRHLHGHLRARQLQEGACVRTSSSPPASTPASIRSSRSAR